ncbi:hypothetical protein ILUMI_26953 [Ignelater luminosus]|uniref:Ig-like domain-containing protein n=1 Tax=Ignelater luminosus TaxID=2038154 RepID=A0A8K0FYF9_IGNLU|nr:hypothetical protein ILUMI_26953 [Ignelater luminosus]
MDFSGHYVLAWKRGIAVLSAGNVKVSPDPRISLVNGYSLEIKDAGPQDAGDYVCQIGTLEPREITHTVEILGTWVIEAVRVSGTCTGARCMGRNTVRRWWLVVWQPAKQTWSGSVLQLSRAGLWLGKTRE